MYSSLFASVFIAFCLGIHCCILVSALINNHPLSNIIYYLFSIAFCLLLIYLNIVKVINHYNYLLDFVTL